MKWSLAAFFCAALAFAGIAIAADEGGVVPSGPADIPGLGPMSAPPRAAPVELPTVTPPAAERKKPVFNKPIYNPETQSYFELHFPGEGKTYGEAAQFNWRGAREYAPTRAYRGARGRLAVIKTKETNDFIVKNLKPGCCPWIGLYYSCPERTLVWVTGELWPLSGYNNWSRIWNVMGTHPNNTAARWSCSSALPAGVHYWGIEGQYKWNANSANKEFANMIIEYPTGKP